MTCPQNQPALDPSLEQLKAQLAEALHQLQTTQELLQESMDMGSQALELIQAQTGKLDAAKKEIEHWKANHANVVRRAQLLRQRPDLPLERISAFDQVGTLHFRLEMIRDALEEGEQKETIMVGAGIWQRLKHFSDTKSNLGEILL